MIPVTAPTDKRFLRARARPVRRNAWIGTALRVGRAVAIVALLAGGAYRAGEMLTASNVLQIEHLNVQGTVRLTTADVASLLPGLRGQNILRADLDEARRTLIASPWVADAVLRRRLPGSVDVIISERRPVGIARLAEGHLFLIDDDGMVIDAFGPRYAEFDLPIIDGLGAATGGRVDRQRVRLAAEVLASLAERPDLARRVSEIDVSDVNDAVLLLDTDAALLRVGDRDFRQRLEGYLDLAPTLRERAGSIDYVDLRYGNHMVVGPGGTGPVARAARAPDRQ